MRVTHVISDLDPAAGGPPMVVSRLAAAQAAQGQDVHLLVYDTPAVNDQIDVDLRKIPGGDRLVLHRIPEPSRLEWVLSTNARREMEQLASSSCVFHIHGMWDPILRAASQVARSSNRPYVLAPHGMLDPWALSEKSWKKKAALAMGYRAMVTRATALHAHSPYEAQCLREGGLNPRVEVIPNGVFMDEFKPAPRPGSFYNAHPELQGQPYILFLARLHEVKGLDLLADAFASILTDLPTIRLVIAGPDFGARASLIEQSKRLGIADRVHLIGPVYGHDKAVAYADAACFCLPSKHESFGMSVAEAMACGVPVVVTESCHFPDVTRVGAGREVKRDAASIATALREVLSSPALRAGMARAGRELIMNTYTWERVAQRSAELYAELLAGSRGERAAARAGVRPAETTT
jgi:glycosyltransferase involved in cell wall biosynthesis